MALAALGFFVFFTDTIPFNGISTADAWKHPSHAVIGGGIPPTQYTGRDNQQVTIKAELRQEVTGGDLSIKFLRAMADTGQPYPLIRGTGELMGSYVITAISADESGLMHDSKARNISFSLSLTKVADTATGLYGSALNLAIGAIRTAAGI